MRVEVKGMHPVLATAHHNLNRVDADASRRALPVFSEINEQILANWATTAAFGGNVLIPHTSFTTEHLTGFPTDGPKRTYVLFPGIGGQPGDSLDRSLKVAFGDLAVHQEADYMPQTEFLLVGWPTSAGGKVNESWNAAVRLAGPVMHGEAAATVVEPYLEERNPDMVVFDGRSKGSRTAAYALTYFPEYEGRRTLVRDHQPGNWVNAFIGYPLDNGIARFRKGPLASKAFPLQPEVQFLLDHADQLTAQGVDINDDSAQKKLKRRALLIDALHMREPRPDVAEDVRIFNHTGIFDLTNIRPLNIRYIGRELLAEGARVLTKGRETTIIDLSAHGGVPFSRRALLDMANVANSYLRETPDLAVAA